MKAIIDIPEEYFEALQEIQDDELVTDGLVIKYSKPCVDPISRTKVLAYITTYIQEIITESGQDKNFHTNETLGAIIAGIGKM